MSTSVDQVRCQLPLTKVEDLRSIPSPEDPADALRRFSDAGIAIPKIQLSAALKAAKAMFETRGNSPRLYRNTLVFLAPDKNRLQPVCRF